MQKTAENYNPSFSTPEAKALIKDCIAGLGEYAAFKKQENINSPVPDAMKKLVERLVDFWALDDGEHSPSLTDFVDAFDEKVYAKSKHHPGSSDTYQSCADVVNGLFLHGEILTVTQCFDASKEILDMSDFMKEVARFYGYETDTLRTMTDKLNAEVRDTLAKYPLPGQQGDGSNVGYRIMQVAPLDYDRGVVLAFNPKAPAPYVTWLFHDSDGHRGYDIGHYFFSEERAKLDFVERVENALGKTMTKSAVSEQEKPPSIMQRIQEKRTIQASGKPEISEHKKPKKPEL